MFYGISFNICIFNSADLSVEGIELGGSMVQGYHQHELTYYKDVSLSKIMNKWPFDSFTLFNEIYRSSIWNIWR